MAYKVHYRKTFSSFLRHRPLYVSVWDYSEYANQIKDRPWFYKRDKKARRDLFALLDFEGYEYLKSEKVSFNVSRLSPKTNKYFEFSDQIDDIYAVDIILTFRSKTAALLFKMMVVK